MGGGSSEPSLSDEDFIRGLAKERAESFTDSSTTSQNQSITNNMVQDVGNKGDMETIIGDNNTINNSLSGNDYSLNMGSINVANNQNQLALFRKQMSNYGLDLNKIKNTFKQNQQPESPQMFAGGSQNFDEKTGSYKKSAQ